MVKEMAQDPLIHIGSHAYEHVVMHAGQDSQTVRENLEKSYFALTGDWGVTDKPTFCFPNGDTSPQWQAMAHEIGYDLSFGSNSAFITRHSDHNFLPRFWLQSRRRLQAVLRLGLVGNAILPPIRVAQSAARRLAGQS